MSREERRRQARRRRRGRPQTAARAVRARLRNWGFLGAVVVLTVGVIALIAVGLALQGDDAVDSSVCPAEMPIDGPVREAVLGDPNAPLTIVEYSDFQCPFCGKAARSLVPQMKAEYLDTGRAKLVFKHYAFLGQESVAAAEAAECAGDQDQFWEYHDKLFANQSGENRGAFTNSNLKRFADELGLDTIEFNECFDSRKYQAKVNNDRAVGCRDDDVNSTPTFFVGTTKIDGVRDWSSFEAAIQQELSKLGQGTPTP